MVALRLIGHSRSSNHHCKKFGHGENVREACTKILRDEQKANRRRISADGLKCIKQIFPQHPTQGFTEFFSLPSWGQQLDPIVDEQGSYFKNYSGFVIATNYFLYNQSYYLLITTVYCEIMSTCYVLSVVQFQRHTRCYY